MEVAARGNDASSSIPTQTRIHIHHPEENGMPISRKHNVCTQLLKRFCTILLYTIAAVLLLSVTVPLAALALSFVLANMVIVPAVAIPLLLLCLVPVRFLQIARHADEYDQLSQLKLLIRTWILLAVVLLTFAMCIFYAISTQISSLKHVIFIGLPLSRWVSIGCIICGVYCLSYVCVVAVYVILRFVIGSQGFGFPEALTEVIDCLLFLFVESKVMKLVIEFKHHKILGLYTQKWIEVTVFVIIGYNIIRLFAYMILSILRGFISPKLDPGVDTKSTRYLLVEKILFRNYLVFCVNWLRNDITFILTSLMILLTWVLYFASHLTITNRAKDVAEFGTRTCISLLIFSLLWLIKTFTLLVWEAQAIYNRLSGKILEAGKDLYFLGIITRQKYDIFNLKYETSSRRTVNQDDEQSARIERPVSKDQTRLLPVVSFVYLLLKQILRNFDEVSKSDSEDEWDEERKSQHLEKKLSSGKRKRIRQELLLQNQTATLFDIEEVGRYLLSTKNSLSTEVNIQHIIESLKTVCSSDDNRTLGDGLKQLIDGKNNTHLTQGSNGTSTNEERNREEIEKSDFKALLTYLDLTTEQLSYEQLGRWMETSRNNCVLLANTIKSGKEVADCLNKTTSLILIVTAIIMWLLLTGLATTKVLVVIASPLLAATFIFGDTCKSLFQGIIFVFVVHPFDVGDLCVIDNKLMEVKAIGVWTSTFSNIEKVGTLEEVIYPTSKLVAEVIINHKTVFDCNDYVEFNLASFDDQKIETLKSQIEDYFNDEDGKSPGTCHTIAVLTTESSIKITVTFEHKIDLSGKTFFECVKEKNKLRSAFIIHVQNLIKTNDFAPDLTSNLPPNTISAGDEAEIRSQNVARPQI